MHLLLCTVSLALCALALQACSARQAPKAATNSSTPAAPRLYVNASPAKVQGAPVPERTSGQAANEPQSTIADPTANVAHEPIAGRGLHSEDGKHGQAPPPTHTVFLGPWLEAHGVPSDATTVTENRFTRCQRTFPVGNPPEDAIQCDVSTDSRGRIEEGHGCANEECVHAGMVLTRIYVFRESKLHSVLDVPSAAVLDDAGGVTEYATSYLVPADDGLSVVVEPEPGSCSEDLAAVRAEEKELRSWGVSRREALAAVRAELKELGRSWGVPRLVRIVCAAQGRYVWHGGAFRREWSGSRQAP